MTPFPHLVPSFFTQGPQLRSSLIRQRCPSPAVIRALIIASAESPPGLIAHLQVFIEPSHTLLGGGGAGSTLDLHSSQLHPNRGPCSMGQADPYQLPILAGPLWTPNITVAQL